MVAALVERGTVRGWSQLVLNPFASDEPRVTGLEQLADYRSHRCTRVSEFWGTRRWTGTQLSAFRPDLIHVHLFHAEVTVASLRPSDATRLLTHHHGDFLVAQGRRFEAILDRWAGKRMDVIVAVSDAVRSFLLDRYRYPTRTVTTIPNGWAGDPLPRIDSDGKTIICTGNFRPEKGHRILLEAFKRVIKEIPDARLVLVGNGPLKDELMRATASLGLPERVTFTGSVEEVWSHLARADVFVLPSLSEPLGIAIIEAMAAGLPVVASAVGGIPELVVDGVSGRLVAPGDPQQLAVALISLLRAPEERDRFGAVGRERATTMTMGSMADAYERLYTTRGLGSRL